MGVEREEARRWVRRKRNFYTILVVYAGLSVLWFAIDVLTGTDDWWFYWPMLGVGVFVAMFGVTGLFGGDWERRQVDKYLQQHGGERNGGEGPG
jgi:hypothetical protein